MPTIAAFTDHPTHPYVRVEVNWADTPAVEHAAVYRVDVETGECTPLRPYICYSGWELLLSCGHGVFWDTEAPFDRPFYYLTTSSEAPCIPASTVVQDTFTRVVVDSWGSATSGQPYSTVSGPSAQYDVNGTQGTITPDTLGTNRYALLDAGTPNFEAQVTLTTNTVPVGGTIGAYGIVSRWVDDNNYYRMGVSVAAATGLLTPFITRLVGGVATVTSGSTGLLLSSGDLVVKVSLLGGSLKLKIWQLGDPEPTTWDIEVEDDRLVTSSLAGLITRRDAGNSSPTVLGFDDLLITDPCVPCAPVTVDTSAGPTTLASDGRFWLKDPVRPCHDRPVPLCPTSAPLTPICGGEGGILFIGVGREIYGANSIGLRPINRRRKISITRPRADAATTLRLQTMTFDDRDDLLDLVEPGTPLLFQGPAEYGVPDRYMDVGDVQVDPALPDLRFPVRTETLPYETVDRPAGPTQGICGARVADICALYPTLDDLAASGFTWDDLIAGQASPVSANPQRRTYNDVNAEFASYNAVNTGGRDYDELYEGA